MSDATSSKTYAQQDDNVRVEQKVVAFPSHNKLFAAIESGDCAAVSQFLDAGMDKNTTSPDGMSLMMMAVLHRKEDILRELIARGADIELRNDEGASAFTFAGMEKWWVGADILLQAGANWFVVDNEGLTALHWCAYTKDPESLRFVKALVDRGFPVDHHVDGSVTAFVTAVDMGFLEMAEYLLLAGADINSLGDECFDEEYGAELLETKLCDLARSHRYYYLLGDQPDPEKKGDDNLDNTPAMEWLIARGACATAKSPGGMSAIDVARERNLPELLAVLEPIVQIAAPQRPKVSRLKLVR